MLNNSKNYKDSNTDLNTQVQNEVERDLNQIAYPLYHGHSQYSEILPITQERPINNQLESLNSIEFLNQNNSASTIDEIHNQNYISLEALKGKMSQEINYEEKIKSKKDSNLKWQDGKVSIKKGKVKVSCNYAFTPTRSSLRVRCIYCRKIYSSVKGFINHRGKCSHFKMPQNNILDYSQMNPNYPANMFNFFNVTQLDKPDLNLQNRSIFNNGLNTQQTENSQQNTQLNCLEIKKFMDNVNPFPINNIFCNKNTLDEVNSVNTLSNKNNTYQDKNVETDIENNTQYKSKFSGEEFHSFDSNSPKNSGLNQINSNNKSNNFENFKLHLYAAISCLPIELLVKIIQRRNPRLMGTLNGREQKIERDKMIDIIFSEITSKKNIDTSNKIDLSCEKEEKTNLDDSNGSNVEDNSYSSVDENLESNTTAANNEIYDDIFLLNIPTFFRHSFPKNQEIKCYICKSTNKDSILMCENCGYTYHKKCQNNPIEHKKNDWFCDHCVEYGNNLILGSKFQVGELVWTNYKGVTWPGQIIGIINQKFELILFHIEKKLERNSNEIQTWAEGLSNIDGLACKGAFIRETQFAVMHWQSVYKGLKYYTNSLRSKPRRLPSISSKNCKQNKTGKKRKGVCCENVSSSVPVVNHPLPLSIKDDYEADKHISDNIQENSRHGLKNENTSFDNDVTEENMNKKLTKESEYNKFSQTQLGRTIYSDISDC
ncbi:PHD finger containing [Cryptosporidium xiaoi]|uniref:PHD finger containing n=1 Tax=Cryptosporidium xiaoi TaxID=659607 RepID=A0AAV9XS89_9CRYT